MHHASFFTEATLILRFQKKTEVAWKWGLIYSPRGKFEVTNMADDQVDLTPEGIPGAGFIEEEIEDWPMLN